MISGHEFRRAITVLVAGLLAALIPAAVEAQSTQGIQVHGRWTIDVVNPDGSLDSHTEFNNAIAPGANGGAALLAQILGARRSTGAWAVVVYGSEASPIAVDSPCGIPATTPPNSIPCAISEPALVVSVLPGAIELSGSFTVITTQSPKVGHVQTRLTSCNSETSATACMTGPFDPSEQPQTFLLTSHALETPLAVTRNQIVQIKVVLTFS